MAEIRVNPTRMELKKLKTRLSTARRGHRLLKDKRDELMRQFLLVVNEAKTLRIRVETAYADVRTSLAIAAAVTSQQVMTESLMIPKAEGNLQVRTRNVMSVTVPQFSLEAVDNRASESCNYGFAFTSGELDGALDQLAALLPDLIRLAELEKSVTLLSDEIERTRRRVNALEYILIPQLERGIKGISMKLEENERGNITRLMKVKDMILTR